MAARHVARWLFRAAGWLLTPLVLIGFAGIGATIGLVVAPRISSALASLVVTIVFALAAAVAGLILWMRMLRENPRLRHTLEMAVDGTPDSPLVQAIIHPDDMPPERDQVS